jgi:hypothetical protein
VALRQIRLWRSARLRLIEASDPSLDEGFHLFEADNGFRWTDGNARLPATLFDGVHGACELDLYIASTTRYPLLASRSGWPLPDRCYSVTHGNIMVTEQTARPRKRPVRLRGTEKRRKASYPSITR